MAKPPDKKPKPSQPPGLRVFPMSLLAGDVLTDEMSESRVIGHPYSSVGGKTVTARRVGEAIGSDSGPRVGRA